MVNCFNNGGLESIIILFFSVAGKRFFFLLNPNAATTRNDPPLIGGKENFTDIGDNKVHRCRLVLVFVEYLVVTTDVHFHRYTYGELLVVPNGIDFW